MSHIEFIGPPGSGKSSIHGKLMKQSGIFGGVDDDAIERQVIERYRNLGKCFQLLPHPIKPAIRKMFIDQWLPPTYMRKYVCQNPDFLLFMHELVDSVEYQPEEVIRLSIQCAYRYQLGASGSQNNEVLLGDELFLMLISSAMWRSRVAKLPYSEVFSDITKPRAVIQVTAPTAMCLKRQMDRGRLGIEGPWVKDYLHEQHLWEEICLKVTEEAEKNDIQVFKVDTSSDVDKIVDELSRKIKELIK